MPLYRGTSTQFGFRKCPYCAVEFKEARAVSDELVFTAGCVGVCGNCGEIWIMDDNLSLRRIEPGELFKMYATCPDADTLETLQNQVRALRRGQSAGGVSTHVRTDVVTDQDPQA